MTSCLFKLHAFWGEVVRFIANLVSFLGVMSMAARNIRALVASRQEADFLQGPFRLAIEAGWFVEVLLVGPAIPSFLADEFTFDERVRIESGDDLVQLHYFVKEGGAPGLFLIPEARAESINVSLSCDLRDFGPVLTYEEILLYLRGLDQGPDRTRLAWHRIQRESISVQV